MNFDNYILERLVKYGIKSPILSQFFVYEEEFEYSSNNVIIGIEKDTDDIVGIDFSDAKRIFIIAPTGAGKSWIVRGLCDRFYLGGGNIFNATDVKPEYYSSIKPNSKKYKKWILKNEKFTGMPVKSYYPLFLNKMFGLEFEHSQFCQISLSDMNVYDMMTLLGIQDDRNAIIDFMEIWDRTMETGIDSIEDLKQTINEDKIISRQRKRRLCRGLDKLVEYGIVGNEYPMQLVDDINRKNIPILNLYGHDRLGQYSFFPSVFVSTAIRNIRAAKAEGRIPLEEKLLFIIDEAHRFVPRLSNIASKREILDCVKTTRAYRISMVFCTQYITDIPDEILSQSQIFLLGHNVDINDIKEILKRKASKMYDNPYEFLIEVMSAKGEMLKYKDGQRDWMLIDTSKQEYIIFNPLAPLSYHLQEGEII